MGWLWNGYCVCVIICLYCALCNLLPFVLGVFVSLFEMYVFNVRENMWKLVRKLGPLFSSGEMCWSGEITK